MQLKLVADLTMFDVTEYFKEQMDEHRMQDIIVAYLKAQYPNLRFISTLVGESNTNKRVRSRNSRLQSHKGQPDLIIFYPNIIDGEFFAGLALELKKSDAKIYKKDGSLRKNAHIEDQAEWLEYLGKCGIYADFAVGLEESIEIKDVMCFCTR